ncbi:MAG: regulatory protein SipA [Crocosphaera sp.]
MNEQQISVGIKVCLISKPPYLKTADPMPMLRPSDILDIGDEGIVMDRRPGGYWGVKFAKGTFLMESQYIALVTTQNSSHKDV